MRRASPVPQSAAEADLEIAAMGGEGDGVAEGPVFVPFTLPGERVRARGAGERRDLVEVLARSPDRTAPPCPHFGVCGGCALQHWAHEPYLSWKIERLVATLARQRIEAEILPAFAAAPGTRRRLTLHARQGSKDAARLGYKMRRSWSLVPVEACPIAEPRLVAAFPALRRLAAPLFEHPKSAPSLHLTLTETGIDVEITGVERKSGGLSADARVRVAEAAAAAGFARVALDGEAAYLARQPMVRFGEASVAMPSGAFLQAVAAAEAAMAAFALAEAAGASRIADLYCGLGAFTFHLARIAPTHAVDSAREAVAALVAAQAGAPGLKGITAEARDLVRRPMLAEEMKRIDVALFDPPRAGAAEQAAQLARSKVARVIAVSCNPATFARDAATLIAGGFRLTRLLPVDQFLWSPHIELAAAFQR